MTQLRPEEGESILVSLRLLVSFVTFIVPSCGLRKDNVRFKRGQSAMARTNSSSSEVELSELAPESEVKSSLSVPDRATSSVATFRSRLILTVLSPTVTLTSCFPRSRQVCRSSREGSPIMTSNGVPSTTRKAKWTVASPNEVGTSFSVPKHNELDPSATVIIFAVGLGLRESSETSPGEMRFGVAPESSKAFASVPYIRTGTSLSLRGRVSTCAARARPRRPPLVNRRRISFFASSESPRTSCPNVKPDGALASSESTQYFPTCSWIPLFFAFLERAFFAFLTPFLTDRS